MSEQTRKAKRKHIRQTSRKKYSLQDVQKAQNIAIEMNRLTKGHLFSKNIKARCVWCGITERAKKECKFSFLTFLDRVQVVLINPAYFRDNEIEAYFIQAINEYANVELPYNLKLMQVSQVDK